MSTDPRRPDSAPDAESSAWEQRLAALDGRLASLGVDVHDDEPAAAVDLVEPDEEPGAVPRDTDGQVDPEGAEEHHSRARAIFDWVVVIGIALLVAFVVRTYVLAHFVVDGVSMATTLHDEDRVFVNKLSYRLHDPNRGDVVVLHELEGSSGERDLIKRVIALPGETLAVTNCQVTIDGRVLEEPYLDPPAMTPGTCGSDVAPLDVPDGHVFVMGDNRGQSMDSRDLGPIDEDDLVGRAFVVFWPRSSWQWL